MNKEERIVESFDQVYREVFPVLIKIAFHITGNVDVSEELCQEAFIKYLSRTFKIPTVEQSRYWLIRVVKNLCFNYIKRKGRESRAIDRFKQYPAKEESLPEKELLEREETIIIQSALMNLPLKLRTVLILKEYANLTYKEIASILRISESNVKVRVFRARAGLEKILSKEDF